MTRVTVDAATAAKLQGLGQFLELYDEAGNRLGCFQPDEKSPAFREWVKTFDIGISAEEEERRFQRGMREGITTAEVVKRLRGAQP